MSKFKNWLLQEMPIRKFDMVGNWGPNAPRRGWDKKSIGILGSDKGVQKIKNMWSKCPVDFDMYFIRQAGSMKHVEIGEVSSEWVQENLKMNIQPDPSAITVLFTQNLGNEKIPMTGWIIGHRFAHAIQASTRRGGNNVAGSKYGTLIDAIYQDFREVLQQAYGRENGPNTWQNKYQAQGQKGSIYNQLAKALGTMKSARDGKIRDFGEFTHELFGQFIIDGRVKFNPLPRSFRTRKAWGKPSPDYYSKVHGDEYMLDYMGEVLQTMEHRYNNEFNRILESAKGHIYVM